MQVSESNYHPNRQVNMKSVVVWQQLDTGCGHKMYRVAVSHVKILAVTLLFKVSARPSLHFRDVCLCLVTTCLAFKVFMAGIEPRGYRILGFYKLNCT